MKTINFAYVDAQDLEDEWLGGLWELSPCKGEPGFSFLVPLRYLQGFKQDMDNDTAKGFPPHACYENICKLIAELVSDGKNALFVCNDNEYRIPD